jgi:hypothetical protein
MHNIWILSLEPVETRYTWQWFKHVPQKLASTGAENGLKVAYHMEPTDADIQNAAQDAIHVWNVPGNTGAQKATTGAFLNFAGTNVWKNDQLNKFVHYVNQGFVKPGDKVWVADAWHTGILQLAYMRDLLDLDFEIHAQWHAGAHDPWDFLGRKIVDKRWAYATERALFWAIDKNYFTTEFYRSMFVETLGVWQESGIEACLDRTVLCGYPNEYLFTELPPHVLPPDEREDIILFPHRIAPEKQIEIFNDLATTMPEYKWVICQELGLTKPQYHDWLGRSKLVFSAALQETLGIAQAEAVVAGAMPLQPNRLSYSEQYLEKFLYPSEWTTNWDAYLANKDKLVELIKTMMSNYTNSDMQVLLREQNKILRDRFISAQPLYKNLLGY